MKSNGLKLSLFLCSFFACLNTYALTSDREQPIQVNADSMVAEEPKGFSHYKGNVLIVQGSLKVIADEVIIYFTDGELDKLIIKGNPAHLQQQPDNSEDLVYSQAKTMEYYATSDRLFLLEDAKVRQGNNHFSGARIEYDTRNSTVSATSEGKDKGRIRAVIMPKPAADANNENP